MSELEESFAKLLGRQPSDADRQRLYRVRDALGLKNNDALWLVLMALDHYQGQYENFPIRIEKAAQNILGSFKSTAEATVQASVEAAKADLAKAVADSAEKVAKQVAGKQRLQWIAGSMAVVALCLGGVFWYAHSTAYDAGFNSGFGLGYSEAKDEKAAAAWANTHEGKLAYRFAQSGELQKLAKCQGKGWKAEKSNCYPHPVEGEGTYGWRMP